MLALAVFFGLLLINAVIASRNTFRVTATSTLIPRRIHAGERATLSLRCVNESERTSPRCGVAIDVATVKDTRHRRLSLPRISPQEESSVTLEVTPSTRGIVQIGPSTLVRGDSFSLILRQERLAPPNTLFVHPRTIDLPSFISKSQHDSDGMPDTSYAMDDLIFHDLRDYAPGDDIRAIHWPSTAKTGHLMVRQFHASHDMSTLLMFDGIASYRSDADFELAVSCYASLGLCLLRDQRTLTVLQPRFPVTDTVHNNEAAQPLSFSLTSPTAFLDSCCLFQRDHATAPQPSMNLSLTPPISHTSPAASVAVIVTGPSPGASDSRDSLLSQSPGVRSNATFQIHIDSEATPSLRKLGGNTPTTAIAVPSLSALPSLIRALT
jgi:hypothetical protein